MSLSIWSSATFARWCLGTAWAARRAQYCGHREPPGALRERGPTWPLSIRLARQHDVWLAPTVVLRRCHVTRTRGIVQISQMVRLRCICRASLVLFATKLMRYRTLRAGRGVLSASSPRAKRAQRRHLPCGSAVIGGVAVVTIRYQRSPLSLQVSSKEAKWLMPVIYYSPAVRVGPPD